MKGAVCIPALASEQLGFIPCPFTRIAGATLAALDHLTHARRRAGTAERKWTDAVTKIRIGVRRQPFRGLHDVRIRVEERASVCVGHTAIEHQESARIQGGRASSPKVSGLGPQPHALALPSERRGCQRSAGSAGAASTTRGAVTSTTAAGNSAMNATPPPTG